MLNTFSNVTPGISSLIYCTTSHSASQEPYLQSPRVQVSRNLAKCMHCVAFVVEIMIRHFVEGNALWMSLFLTLHNNCIASMWEEKGMRHRQDVYWGNYDWIYATRFFLTLCLAFSFFREIVGVQHESLGCWAWSTLTWFVVVQHQYSYR